jgi:hypothetical protein
MEVWVKFFKDGFFGYGEPGDFTYFSLAHFVPILVLLPPFGWCGISATACAIGSTRKHCAFLWRSP